MRRKQLTGVDESFYVRVLTDEDFGPEKQALDRAATRLLPDPPPDVTDEGTEAWKAERPEAVATLHRKVRVLPKMTSERQEQLSLELVRSHMRAADLRRQIRSYQPQLWEFINDTRADRERVLALHRLASHPRNRPTLRDEVTQLTARLQAEPVHLDVGLAENLAWGFVADWLIRCPLDPLPLANT